MKYMIGLLSLLVSFSTVAATNLPALHKDIAGAKRGDIIAPMFDEQIAAWCDFTKQIVITSMNTLCVYVGSEKYAKNTPKSHLSTVKKLSKATHKDLTPQLYEMKEYSDAETIG